MRTGARAISALVLAVPAAFAAAEWAFEYRPAAVRYAIHGGGLGDPIKASPGDSKVVFEVSGRAAQDLFGSIGPDRRDRCGPQEGMRFRSRDDDRLVCTRTTAGDYRCYFGFDLTSGRSIGGSLC